MKTFKSLLIFAAVAMFFQVNGQTIHNVGGHKILKNNSEYFEIYGVDTLTIKPDKIVLMFKSNVSQSEKNAFANRHGLTFLKATQQGISLFSINSGIDYLALIENLATDTALEYYDLNYLAEYMSTQPPNNDIPWEIWALNPNIMWPYEATEVYDAWGHTKGNPNVIVANLDNGIDLNHVDLGKGEDTYSNIWINQNEIPGNGIDDDNNYYVDDYYGWNFGIINNDLGNTDLSHENPLTYRHGTMTASIISAKTNNNTGVFGIAGGWNNNGVKLMTVKLSNLNDVPETAQVPYAIEYAVLEGARVINMAFGYVYPIQAIEDEISYWYGSGVTFLASAGNDHESTVRFPASSEYVIAVGATQWGSASNIETRWSNKAPGSNWGDDLEIMAPGSPMRISLDPTTNGEYIYDTHSGESTSASVSFASGVVALMLSSNPCLDNDQIREILKNTADKLTCGSQNYNYYNDPNRPGFNLYMGYGRINAKLALEYCLPGTPITIDNTVTPWTTDMELYHNITIEDNGVLEINDCTLSLAPEAKIIVKPGGRLILNNAKLEGLCGSSWQGVEIWGNRSQHQFLTSNGKYLQGYAKLDDATIENAVCALSLWKPGDYYKTGGIVHATNTIFRNNVKSVHALLYKNFHPTSGNEMEYNTYFKNCSFDIDAEYYGNYIFNKHVDLNQVNGIGFKACNFSLSPDAKNIANGNHAIASYSSGFKVEAICTAAGQNGCLDWTPCTFTGFQTAISANNVSLNPYTFKVDRAIFSGNSTGIASQGVDNPIIINSDFFLNRNKYNYEPCSYGIYISGTNNFAIEENRFYKESGAPMADYLGIGVFNCPTISEIYKNEFTGLSVGNYAYGKNWTFELYQGLEYLCNKNTSNWADFFVTGSDSHRDNAIQSKQGNALLPAGNKFSPSNVNYHIYNNTGNLIGYYYCESCPDEFPEYVENVTREAVAVENPCISHYGGVDPTTKILLSSVEKTAVESTFALANANLNDVETLYNNLKDGGDTESKAIEISTATSNDMWELRTTLLGDSPHLSTEILKIVADRTDIFTEAVIFDIIAANPDELKKDELLKYLEDKEDPLPDFMLDILEQVAMGTTYKTVLEQQMARYSHERARAAGDMVRSILNEESLDMNELRNWLDNLGGIEADRQIISTFVHEANYSAALSLAQALPQIYNLSGEELAGHERYLSLLQLQFTLFNEDRNIEQLNNDEQEMLHNFAMIDQGKTAAIAKSILESFYGKYFDRCKPIDGESSFKNQAANSNQLAETFGLTITVKPNPAIEWVAFDYTLPNQETSAMLMITNSEGNVVEVLNLTGNQGQKLWDTRSVVPGPYIYTIKSAGFIKSGKLIVL